jgi:hypothetical protein
MRGSHYPPDISKWLATMFSTLSLMDSNTNQGWWQEDTPLFVTYAAVVSRETVRIALIMAALDDLEVKAADVENAYLTAPRVKRYGQSTVQNSAHRPSTVWVKGSGASYRNHIADCMRHLGYESCKADPDLWMMLRTRDDGFNYYSYVLIYVDEILAISHTASTTSPGLTTT